MMLILDFHPEPRFLLLRNTQHNRPPRPPPQTHRNPQVTCRPPRRIHPQHGTHRTTTLPPQVFHPRQFFWRPAHTHTAVSFLPYLDACCTDARSRIRRSKLSTAFNDTRSICSLATTSAAATTHIVASESGSNGSDDTEGDRSRGGREASIH